VLHLTGHHAWQRIHWKDDAEKTVQAWKEWLSEAYREYTITGVRVDEQLDGEHVEVDWVMAEREDEVLGDEVSLSPSRPLGPVHQPFIQTAAQRLTPVYFSYPGREEVELTLHWPDGWTLDSLPETRFQNAAGAVLTEMKVDETAHSMTYRRRLDILYRELDRKSYPAAQALFAVMERQDAKTLALTKR